ncbi:MAG: hypothetical protein H6619_06780 [Deltaproteobacteria bacterium]|nr:hypothetical protein [Deltaproteobacteria bacterium]
MKAVLTLSNLYTRFGRYISAAFYAPSKKQSQAVLFSLGFLLLVAGVHLRVSAQGDVTSDMVGAYNDERISEAVNRIFGYLEGSFGALIMVAAGLAAIMAAAFGQYRAALGMLVVAVGAFILRSLVGTFFNDDTIG